MKSAFRDKSGGTIQFSLGHLKDGKGKILLTNRQNNKLEKHKKIGKGVWIEFSYNLNLTQSDVPNYPDASNVKLTDNFVPYLFSRIEDRKHNKLVDDVELPKILLRGLSLTLKPKW